MSRCIKERFRNESEMGEFSRACALQNGIALSIRLAIALCNVGWLCPRSYIHQIRGGLFLLPSHVQISLTPAATTEPSSLQAVTTIELAPADVCADCGARLLEELEVKDRA